MVGMLVHQLICVQPSIRFVFEKLLSIPCGCDLGQWQMPMFFPASCGLTPLLVCMVKKSA